MMHERTHFSGTYCCEQLGLAAGWVDRPGLFNDELLVWNTAKDVGLLFAGENFADSSGFDGDGVCRCHYDPAKPDHLVHLYEQYGRRFFVSLNGWFSGLVIDRRKGNLVLFNDRYGLRRVYYHESPEGFYFSSEAKALLRVIPELRRLESRSLGEFFGCGCALQGRTLFQGVRLVPPGSLWTFKPGGGVSKLDYFKPSSWEEQPKLESADYYQLLKNTFARVLPRYLSGKDRIGISLTGGVDSRLLIAWARQSPGSTPCYTFSGMYRECVDVKIARRVAEICGQPHQVIPVGQAFLKEFPILAEQTVYLTDGAMDVSGTPDLYANRIAREIAPVRLTGNYGGEILRRLIAFKPMRLDSSMFHRDFLCHFQSAIDSYRSELEGHRLSFIAFKQTPWHHYARLALEQTQIKLRSPFLDNELVSLAYRAPDELAARSEVSLRLIREASSVLAGIGTDRGVNGRPVPLWTDAFRFLHEFMARAEYAYDYGMPNWLVRVDNLLRPLHLERLFLGRHKFYHFRYWYRNQLAWYLKQVLLDHRTLSRPYLDRRRVEQMVLDHTAGRKNHTLELHRVLSCELIQRTLIEAS